MRNQGFRSLSAALLSLAAVSTAGAQDAAPSAAANGAIGAADADSAFASPGKFMQPDGEKLYRRVCAACHMADGKGAMGAGSYPSLAKNEKLASGAYPAMIVLQGLNGMPAFGGMMSDRQVADVVNYVRTHMGNRYRDRVTTEQVKALRP